MDIELIIRNYLNNSLKDQWNNAMRQCSAEQISDLTVEFDNELSTAISEICHCISSAVDDLDYTITDFLSRLIDSNVWGPEDSPWLFGLPMHKTDT